LPRARAVAETAQTSRKKAPAKFIDRAIALGADSAILWGVFYSNMAYASPIVTWYIRYLEFGSIYSSEKLDEAFAKGTIRISLGKNNTSADVEVIATALVKIMCPF
jgi:hypothetical protein